MVEGSWLKVASAADLSDLWAWGY